MHAAARIDFCDLKRLLLQSFVQRQVVVAVGARPLESEHLQSGRLPDPANLGAPQSFEHVRLGEQHEHPLTSTSMSLRPWAAAVNHVVAIAMPRSLRDEVD